jgi:pimeloyl-ACP methyl ester carboxylesterase
MRSPVRSWSASVAEVVARGVRFHVVRLGAGERTVVFLHGLVMDNLSSWYFTVANAMARTAEVILYDLRGHGRSERPPSGYGVAEMVADLDGLLDALGVGRPVYLVGNSVGGLLALAFAAAHPERAAGCVLVDGHVGDEDFGSEMAATLALEGEARDRKIAESFRHWLGRHSERKRTRLAETAGALVHGTSLVADMRASAALTDADLGRVRCPVLALYGERSDVRARGERLARVLSDCTVRIVPSCTHSVLWEATERVREEVLAFVGGR